MPAYDIKCPNGHINEIFVSRSEFSSREGIFPCQECDAPAEWFPSFYYNSPAQPVTPTYIHKDAEGNVRFVLDKHAPVPPGFELVELRNSYEVHKFEREINDRDSARAREFHARQEEFRQGQLRANREAMQEFLEGKAWTDSNGELRHGLSPKGRKFYEAMRRVSEERKHSAKSPEFFIEAYSMDSSNREAYHDASSRFQRERK